MIAFENDALQKMTNMIIKFEVLVQKKSLKCLNLFKRSFFLIKKSKLRTKNINRINSRISFHDTLTRFVSQTLR